MLGPNHERNVSTRDRPARTGADARIEESEATGEVCLALRPYGRNFNGLFFTASKEEGSMGSAAEHSGGRGLAFRRPWCP